MPNTSEYVIKKANDICKKANALDDAISHHRLSGVTECYISLTKTCVELTNTVKRAAYQDVTNIELFERNLSYIDDALVSQENGVTHIHLNCLLPARPKGKYLDERDTIRKTFIVPLNQAIMEKRLKSYTEKVVMVFIHTFKEGTKLMDHDNFLVKPIIDGISSVLLPDDSPEYVSYYMDHKVGESDSTDIYILPQKAFYSFLKQQIKNREF